MINQQLREINWQCCPDRYITSLKLYLDHGIMPGHFLTAVLQGDLFEAHARADADSWRLLSDLVKFLYNEFPQSAYGSYERCLAFTRKVKEASGTNIGESPTT